MSYDLAIWNAADPWAKSTPLTVRRDRRELTQEKARP
jgi:hypothetical protein